MRVCVNVCVYMLGQPCVPTEPCTDRGLDNMAARWFTDARRTQPWNEGRFSGRTGTVTPPGGDTREWEVSNFIFLTKAHLSQLFNVSSKLFRCLQKVVISPKTFSQSVFYQWLLTPKCKTGLSQFEPHWERLINSGAFTPLAVP